jgi:hypothetical protein
VRPLLRQSSNSRSSRHRSPAAAPASPSPLIAPSLAVAPQAHRTGSAAGLGSDAHLLALSNERQEVLCSVIGLLVKLGLVAVTAVSLCRLAGAYQQRMERQGEIAAVLELESAKLAKARERFDQLFMMAGEQSLIREQSQWIAPNRMRVVWQDKSAFPTVETAAVVPSSGKKAP